MFALPILGQGASKAPPPPVPRAAGVAGEAPWFHLVPGSPPIVMLVGGSQVYELDDGFAAQLAAGDGAALLELRGMETARSSLMLDDVTPPPTPSALSLNLAQACNLSCHYCYADEGRFQGDARRMPEHVAFAAIDRLMEAAPGTRVTVGFIGGEPFLNRQVLHRSVEHARARAAAAGIHVGFSVTTNGTLLRDDDIALLRDNPFAVSVSLDGDAATHDRHRPARDGLGSHARALDALAPLLRDPGGTRVAARSTVTRDDLRVADRVRALLGLGFHEAGVSPARTGPAPELVLRDADWPIFLEEMGRAADEEVARLRAAPRSEPFRFGNLGIAMKELHRGACRPLPCGAGYGYVSVSAEGRYFTCHRTIDDPRFLLGDAETGPGLEARTRFLASRHVDRQEPCGSCWARYLCGGGCHAEVVSAGRAGCDYIRGWLDRCLRIYNMTVTEMPHLLGAHEAKEGTA